MSSAMNKVKQCEAIIGYEFANKARGIEALYAFPAYRREPGSNLKKNDALAIFGEVVLLENLCQQWLRMNLSTGACFRSNIEWTTIRQDVANNEYLAKVGNNNGLDQCVVLDRGTTNVTDKTMATCVKAVLGAVKFDGGDAAVAAVLRRLKLGHELLEPVMLNISQSSFFD
ncbi:hypothetical protein LTR99_001634 [Exophiala xenobiotica]|uniref:RNase III domain-containing protein n=1 Tax=Vermiconidia calcicola TaxID=1690605 RepID=A0AAV9QLE6_9PEZI|nr:hypothetical protein LTR92_008970 [Exophiala xenobiotica]KAK5544143.1 hypothetical protein LTR25_001758 [Vermiconidia calcicola]KAK5547576.1 hypothetical protein LTR23_002329 [Chaetothyriales sp. CCFEE 6169]KAK5271208.1 hypothetical protein LTR96_003032 [Exophiala xenobiotica]KAK5308658.1 hypothetical protein LTR99_001634 [Exophiala xenobiotica]